MTVRFGASYYHEYQPYERLEADLDLMVEAGFTTIRVGESTWASYEPADGEISFAALERVVDAAHQRGLEVIVGTPTYAIPPWLFRAHPEVMAVLADGRPVAYGGRQNVDFTHPTFRRYAERIIRAMGDAFGNRPGVIGFQVDNEIGVYRLAGDAVMERFRQHVLEHVGDVDSINAKWGLTYWSQRLSSIDELWGPEGNTNPGYALEWMRFQAALTVEFLGWQRDILREHVADDRFIFHDTVGGDSLGSTALRPIAEALDHTAVNVYLPMQRALERPQAPDAATTGLAPFWLLDAGPSVPEWKADLAYSLRGPRGSSFAITEAQAGSIGAQATHVPPFPGQLRQLAHLFASRGADLLAYWHWHTLHYGAETYWGGVIGHDLEPGRIYREVAELGQELRKLAPALEGAVPDADVALLYSRDSLQALEFDPMLLVPGTAQPDVHSYHRVFMRMYDAAVDEGVQVRVVHPDSDWRGEKVLLVPALYVADDVLLQRLIEHAENGAHVVLTFRSGYTDEWVRARWATAPGALRPAVGASYQESSTLIGTRRLLAASDTAVGPSLSADAVAEGWMDLLVPEDAEVLAKVDDSFLGGYAAITSNTVGRGRMTWLGVLPDQGSVSAVVRWALAERDVEPVADVWSGRPESVHVTSMRRPDGTRVWFVSNNGWQAVEVALPRSEALTDAATGERIAGTISLDAWGSVVLARE
ncbi:beta-galactosidase [Leifsonia sp. fls2-241-R2A-40a]|uniref:beta-galactosidase n=1 Tax=Leifsonia sp. fls2-241-R2A-40a TaxID=3040290 RepID=UPI00254CF186|nr:beta-galactosidase [Leifsonia sp. fls2-241-R2A-40a]